MAIFTNQAAITLGDSVTNSNIVTGEITTGLSISKTAATLDYALGETVTYVVTLTNATSSSYTGLTLTDDLGAFLLADGVTTVTPLDYVEGSLLYYVNGVQSAAPTVNAGPPLNVSGIDVPSNSTATLIYQGRVNAFAPVEAGAGITNTVTVDLAEDQSATATVPVREAVNLSIAKAICPAVITDGRLTYTLIVQNTGNLAVDATDNLIVSDTFDPILRNITVTINGVTVEDGVGYTYNEVTGEFATLPGAIPVPAATITRDPVSGAVITTPGSAVVTVTGNV